MSKNSNNEELKDIAEKEQVEREVMQAEAKKTVTTKEFGAISSKINNNLLQNLEVVPIDSKLNAMLNSFRNEYGNIAVARKNPAPNHLEVMETCRKAAIAKLSVKNRIGGVLARAGSSQTDIDKFNQIIFNLKSGKENLLEGVQAKPPKRSIREMFGDARKAMSSYLPKRMKGTEQSRKR